MMELPEGEAHIWYFDVADFSENIESYASCLSEEEIVRSNKFIFSNDKTVNVLARGSLRMLSSYYLGYDSGAIEFKYGTYGKPDYNFPANIRFNVSHSGKLIVLAFVKNSEIGVDIEKIKTNFDVLNIAENFFSRTEINRLQAVPLEDLYSAFYRCWTRKESFIKAKGAGLSFPLASFTVSLNENDAKLLNTEWNTAEKEEWQLFSFGPVPGYVGALCVNSNIQKVSFHNWADSNSFPPFF